MSNAGWLLLALFTVWPLVVTWFVSDFHALRHPTT